MIRIHTTETLLETTRFIKKHQGEQGYILTTNPHGECDTIYATLYDCGEDPSYLREFKIMAVREKHATIEFALDVPTDGPFEWIPIFADDVQLTATIYAIANAIEQYVEED